MNSVKSIKEIARVPVTSSNIKSVGYHNGILTVEFSANSVYAYINVPREHYDIMANMKCESVGKYFYQNIKNNFTCIKG